MPTLTVSYFCSQKGNRGVELISGQMLHSVTLLLRWRPSKIGVTSFNTVTRRYFISHSQVPPKRLSQKTNAQDLLTVHRRLNLREIAETVLDNVQAQFVGASVRVGETWIHWYTLVTKELSNQWISSGKYALVNIITIVTIVAVKQNSCQVKIKFNFKFTSK